MSGYLMEVDNLCQWFPVKGSSGKKKQYVKAVNGVSFGVKEGETLGIVGESGCGKSTLGRTMIKLLDPTGGNVYYKDMDITGYTEKQMRPLRKDIQIMFQDPYASLDPRMTIGDIIAEPMDIRKLYKNPKERMEKIVELMEECGLNKSYVSRYPHEFSGGQRQRIGIARALSVDPKLIICDEPVSALDVSIQSQIINLLMELQRKRNLSLVFISHDLGVVHHIADRIVVMYLGKIMEMADKEELFERPAHPYTKALLSSIPVIGDRGFEKVQPLEGDLPSPVNPPEGCPFRTRCPHVCSACKNNSGKLLEIAEGHFAACDRWQVCK